MCCYTRLDGTMCLYVVEIWQREEGFGVTQNNSGNSCSHPRLGTCHVPHELATTGGGT